MLGAWAELIRSGTHPKPGPKVDDRAGFSAKFVEVHPRLPPFSPHFTPL